MKVTAWLAPATPQVAASVHRYWEEASGPPETFQAGVLLQPPKNSPSAPARPLRSSWVTTGEETASRPAEWQGVLPDVELSGLTVTCPHLSQLCSLEPPRTRTSPCPQGHPPGPTFFPPEHWGLSRASSTGPHCQSIWVRPVSSLKNTSQISPI